MPDDPLWETLAWVGIGFSGLCATLFWSRISVYWAERSEQKKARIWAARSRQQAVKG